MGTIDFQPDVTVFKSSIDVSTDGLAGSDQQTQESTSPPLVEQRNMTKQAIYAQRDT